jgi:hypothetical protein
MGIAGAHFKTRKTPAWFPKMFFSVQVKKKLLVVRDPFLNYWQSKITNE